MLRISLWINEIIFLHIGCDVLCIINRLEMETTQFVSNCIIIFHIRFLDIFTENWISLTTHVIFKSFLILQYNIIYYLYGSFLSFSVSFVAFYWRILIPFYVSMIHICKFYFDVACLKVKFVKNVKISTKKKNEKICAIGIRIYLSFVFVFQIIYLMIIRKRVIQTVVENFAL